ncbi:DUF3304 domain-containing protein [Sulfuriferula nivalis]|uniref:DUF3304 domain-containing protein n=1 Tax=Sulfuriferula nivalis TaxID=2675298 RepID=A0A809REH4_9PROT|nr:DUF3304 domain-containing protein [Sulfuriferula nivalis]BBP00036.1 hypothetical protein SFSGTM_07440 [Sulfuriferula nivalis]
MHFNKGQFTGHSFMLLCLLLLSVFTLTACKPKNPEMVGGLSVEVLNYSQEAIDYVKINGNIVRNGADAAKIGGAMGGGSSCCSGEISSIKPTANVTVESVRFANGKSGDVIIETYTTQAVVELPFPDSMGTLVVHILPGRKVVLEVAPGPSRPRQDLMDAQIKALGLTKVETDSSYMRSERPKYTGYYKPD